MAPTVWLSMCYLPPDWTSVFGSDRLRFLRPPEFYQLGPQTGRGMRPGWPMDGTKGWSGHLLTLAIFYPRCTLKVVSQFESTEKHRSIRALSCRGTKKRAIARNLFLA